MNEALDRAQLEIMVNSYAKNIDRGDFAGLGRLFRDGTWNSRSGAAESEAYLHRNMILYSNGTPRTTHMVSNLVIDFTGEDEAEATSCITLFLQPDGEPTPRPVYCLDYHDWFSRTSGSWSLKHRSVAPRFGDFTGHLRQPPPAPTDPAGGTAAASAPTPFDIHHGLDDIEQLRRIVTADARAMDDEAGWSTTLHAVTNLDIDVRGSTAAVTCVIIRFEMRDAVTVAAILDVDDAYAKLDDGWNRVRTGLRTRFSG